MKIRWRHGGRQEGGQEGREWVRGRRDREGVGGGGEARNRVEAQQQNLVVVVAAAARPAPARIPAVRGSARGSSAPARITASHARRRPSAAAHSRAASGVTSPEDQGSGLGVEPCEGGLWAGAGLLSDPAGSDLGVEPAGRVGSKGSDQRVRFWYTWGRAMSSATLAVSCAAASPQFPGRKAEAAALPLSARSGQPGGGRAEQREAAAALPLSHTPVPGPTPVLSRPSSASASFSPLLAWRKAEPAVGGPPGAGWSARMRSARMRARGTGWRKQSSSADSCAGSLSKSRARPSPKPTLAGQVLAPSPCSPSLRTSPRTDGSRRPLSARPSPSAALGRARVAGVATCAAADFSLPTASFESAAPSPPQPASRARLRPCRPVGLSAPQPASLAAGRRTEAGPAAGPAVSSNPQPASLARGWSGASRPRRWSGARPVSSRIRRRAHADTAASWGCGPAAAASRK
jgi:hypothetical protein